MKKIFTLVSIALCAMSANAQTETFSVMNGDVVCDQITNSIANPTQNNNQNLIGVPESETVFPVGTWENANTTGDFSAITGGSTIVLNEYVWEASTANMKLKAVSTPNADAKPEEAWQNKGNGGNESMAIEGGVAAFTKYVAPKNGNPSIGYYDFYEKSESGGNVHRVADNYWTPGCGKLPVKGCYYEFTPAKDGVLTMGLWANKNLNQRTFYVVDETAELLPYGNIKLKGFRQNNTYEKNEAGESVGGFKEFALNEDYCIDFGEDKDTNRAFFGLLTFDVKAGKKYYVFSSKSQIGIFGFEFRGTGTGIENVENAEAAKVAPKKVVKNGQIMIGDFNIAGQRVK
ncbi:hypothetical protein HPS57_08290 [Prevotella sp. PINT]|uniref:hypothetical protein n=1 Tax=Palleniella intestinalis TaxID=2736291 RepID=UPI0015577BE1|nr:hypothetical protein [Palleniella intestinalis]NPD81972.1 hypothetical protein [Palleniella intestinalis]